MANLTIPPYRAALLTNADGSPVTRMGANGEGVVMTERQWYMFWQSAAQQINDGATLLGQLAGLVDYGNHADRPDPQFATDGALYVEQDRGSVLYQNQGGVWQYIAGIMYGTLVPDQRPADLGPAADAGFQFRTNVDPAQAFAWSGTAWIETTPIRYGTHAARLAAPIAGLVSGMLWMETDRGSVIYQNQGGTWLFLSGTMWGTLVPDQRPTDLGVHDAGFGFRTTPPPPREFIWNQTAWVEVTNISGATGLTTVGAIPKVTAPGSLAESAMLDNGTIVTATNRDMKVIGAIPVYVASNAGGNQPGRFGKINDATALLSRNVSFDGANWNLDNIAADADLLLTSGGQFLFFYLTAGANPRPPALTVTLDTVSGAVNVTTSYKVAGVKVVGPQGAALTATGASVSGIAGATYTATEQTILNNAVALANRLKVTVDQMQARLQSHGLIL
jgi:hypothetical protein